MGFRVHPEDRKRITETAKRVARSGAVRCEVTRRFVQPFDASRCKFAGGTVSTFNIHLANNGDIDDGYSSRYTWDELAKVDDDPRLSDPVVVLDIMVAKRTGFGQWIEWEAEEYISPRFENGRLVSVDTPTSDAIAASDAKARQWTNGGAR